MKVEYEEPPCGMAVDSHGNLKWYGMYNFYTNPEGLIVTVKVVCMAMVLVVAFLGIFIPALEMLLLLGLVGCMILYIALISYYILAVLQGGKAFYLYTMGEQGIVGVPTKRTKDTLQAIAMTTLIVGILARNCQTAGAGTLALGSQQVYIDFSRVRKIKVKPGRNLICIKYKLKLQHIYVTSEQLEFVANYIRSHCGKQVEGDQTCLTNE